jgi:hypothetical protein
MQSVAGDRRDTSPKPPMRAQIKAPPPWVAQFSLSDAASDAALLLNLGPAFYIDIPVPHG